MEENYKNALNKAKEIYDGPLGDLVRDILECIFPELEGRNRKTALEKEIETWIPGHIIGGEGEWKYCKQAIINWGEIVARHFYEFAKAEEQKVKPKPLIKPLDNENDYMPLKFEECLIHRLKSICSQQKQSEEDENTRKRLVETVRHAAGDNGVHISEELERRYTDWLERQKDNKEDFEKGYACGYKAGETDTINAIQKEADKARQIQYDNLHYEMGELKSAGDIYENCHDAMDQEKKPEWRKEDEEMRNDVINDIKFLRTTTIAVKIIREYDRKIAWLEHLPSGKWKPTEHQMLVLLNAEGTARADGCLGDAKVLASLYEQLKKLRRQ